MRGKVIFSALLLAAQIFANLNIPVFAENTYEQSNIAYVEFSDAGVKTNVTTVTLGNDESPPYERRGGEKCWVMRASETADKQQINIAFASEFVDASGTAAYDFEIEFFDAGRGYFSCWYDSLNGEKYADTVFLANESVWKTAKFTLDDAVFNKGLDSGFDFKLTITVPVSVNDSVSSSAVAIKSIRVTRNDNKNPIYVDSLIEESGAAFEWYSSEKIIYDCFENRTDKALTVDVRRIAIGEETQKILFDETETLTFEPKEKKTIAFDFSEYEKCEQYEYKIFITSEEHGIESVFTPIRFAIIKTDPDGKKNTSVFMNTLGHLKDNYTDLIEVADKCNIGGVRMPLFWWMVESEAEEKDSFVFDGEIKDFVEKLAEKNIKILPILGNLGTGYSSRLDILPSTTEEMAGFRSYVRFMAEQLNSYGIEQYEIWNEPDIGDNNSVLLNDGVTYMDGAAYVPVYNAALEEIRAVNTNALVLGAGVCSGGTGIQFAEEALRSGWGDTLDGFSFHPYHNYREEMNKTLLMVEEYEKMFADYGLPEDVELWISESGVSPADAEVLTDENRGNLNTRKLYYLPEVCDVDAITLFNLDGRGLVEYSREDMFGHLADANADLYQNTNPYMPLASMLKIAAECYVMADSTPTKNIYEAGENVILCEYKSNKFNADILTINTVIGNETVTLQLGCDKLDYYDEFGNMTTIYGENGRYTFTADESPGYIVGNFETVEISQDNIVDYDKTVLDAAKGDEVQFTITNNTDNAYSTVISRGYGLKIVENKGFSEQKATISAEVMPEAGTHSYVTVSIMKNDKIVQQSKIKVMLREEDSSAVKPVKPGKYSLSYFNTFDEYTKKDNDYELPEGFRQWPQGLNPVATALRGQVETETGSRALYVEDTGTYTNPMFSFDTLVQEGTAHISFDMKTDKAINIYGSTTKTGSRNPYSYAGMFKGESVYTVNNIYLMRDSEGVLTLCGVEDSEDISVWKAADAGAVDTGWHKYDLVFDLDKDTYTPYIDGQKLTNDGVTYENLNQIYDLKNIYFNITDGNTWIDNLAAYNYETPSDGTLKAPVMKAEEVNGVSTENGSVNVSFSEHITAASPAFTAINVETGKQYAPSTATKLANSSYQLTFASLDEGTYKVTASGITGTISGKAPVSEAVFSTLTVKKVNEKELILIDEDFADYEGGVPTGWTRLDSADTSALTLTEGPNGENAVNIAKAADYTGIASSIYYLFDNDYKIHGDNFTIEFDVNNLEAGWDIGLIRDSDVVERGATTRSTKDRTLEQNITGSTYSVVAHQKYENVLFGSRDANSIQVQKSKYNLRRLNTGDEAKTVVTGLTNDWHHIKAEVNPQASTVILTVDGVKYPAESFPPEMLATVTHADYADGELSNHKYYHKLQGIRISNSNCTTNGVSFANVKVYKENSYLTYQDFEGKLAASSDAGWYTYFRRTDTSGNLEYTECVSQGGVNFDLYYTNYVNPYITKIEDKNGGTAIKLTNGDADYHQKPVVTLLDKPIEKNKAFVVEFDAKTNASDWSLIAVPEGAEHGETTAIDSNNDGTTDTNYDPTNSVIGGNAESKLGIGTLYQYFNLSEASISNTQALGTLPLSIAEDEWYHYKYIVTPNPGNKTTSNCIRVTAELTAPDGTVTLTGINRWDWGSANRLREYATSGIGVKINTADTTDYVAMDNLKVYQLDTSYATEAVEEEYTTAYVKSVKAVGLDGDGSFVTGKMVMSANTKQIEVEFSSAPASSAVSSVTLTTANGEEVGRKSISGNVLTICFEGTALVPQEALTLDIMPGIKTDDELTEDAHSYTITVDDDAELKVTDVVLYETISSGTKGDTLMGITVPEATVPVKGTSIVGTPKLVISGYNGKTAADIFSVAAKYADEGMKEATADTISAKAAANFEREILLESLLDEETTTKIFTWKKSTLEPLHTAWQE